MRAQQFRKLLTGAAALALTACGGGGSVGTAFIPTAPMTPTPTPTPASCEPACLQPVMIFPGIVGTTNFASVGLEANGTDKSAASLVRDGFAVSYNAEAGVYIIDVPSSAPGGFYDNIANTPSASFWNGKIAEAPANVSISASVFKPQPTNPVIQLTYTTYSLYGSTYQGGAFGFVAFGTPTPASGVPISGTASYSATVEGATPDRGDFIKGNATLQFNFAAGTLNGHFDPVIYDLLAFGPGGLSLGRYDFTNTVYSSGSTSFSGGLTRAGVTGAGTFEGQFSGPNAQELMARWTAPFVDPRFNVTSDMFGVWVGKR